MNKRELTIKEKWYPVDQIINNIKYRKRAGLQPTTNDLEDYVDYNFNGGHERT